MLGIDKLELFDEQTDQIGSFKLRTSAIGKEQIGFRQVVKALKLIRPALQLDYVDKIEGVEEDITRDGDIGYIGEPVIIRKVGSLNIISDSDSVTVLRNLYGFSDIAQQLRNMAKDILLGDIFTLIFSLALVILILSILNPILYS